MKKLFTVSCMLVLATAGLKAQTTVFSEDFSSGMPGSFTIIDNDGLTPDTNVKFMTSAWIDTSFGIAGDMVAVSTSYYSPAGTSDDWMITSQVTLPAGCFLSWDARSFSASYPDGYEVRISTAGNAIADLTTVLYSTAGEPGGWSTHYVSLAAYAGQSVYVAFRNNTNDGLLLGVDNIKVFVPIDYDVAIASSFVPEYILNGASQPISGTLINWGGQQITSLDIHYSLNNGTPVNQTLTGIAIDPFTAYNFSFSTPWVPSAPNLYNLRIWADNINGNADMNNANDTLQQVTGSVLTTVPAKNVLIEEGTGAWCGYCPDGALRLGQIIDAYPNVIGVSIHDNDAMDISEGNTVNSTYLSGFPSGLVDRYLFRYFSKVEKNRGLWDSLAVLRGDMVVPVSVTCTNTFAPANRQLVVDMTANFFGDDIADYRVNCYIVEDSVSGTGTGWDQHNYYSSATYAVGGPSHYYYNFGDPIIGFQHMHVLRKMLGGAWGTDLVIPDTVTANQVFNKQYTYTVPSAWDANNLKVVAVVQKYNSDITKRPVMNSVEQNVNISAGMGQSPVAAVLNGVYPNPFSTTAGLLFTLRNPASVQIRIYNVLGEMVYADDRGSLSAGQHQVVIDASSLPAGIYQLNMVANGNSLTKKITIEK